MRNMKNKGYKVIVSLAMVLATIFTLIPTTAMASPLEKVVNLMSGSGSDITVIVNGEEIYMDSKPFLQPLTGRTFVPIRFIGEALDGKVDYTTSTKEVKITKGSKKIKIYIGKKNTVINGTKGTTDTAPLSKDGRTFVPLRFVAENLDCTVDWDGSTKTVTITAKDYVAEEPKEEVINTIESLGLETEPISNYGKVFVDPKGFYKQQEVVIIKKSHFPLQIGVDSYLQLKDLHVSQDRKEITLTTKAVRLNGEVETSIGSFCLATKKDGISRWRNALKTEKLSDGSIKGWFDVIAYTDDRIDPNFKNFTLNSVEYIVFASSDLGYFVALPISEVLK